MKDQVFKTDKGTEVVILHDGTNTAIFNLSTNTPIIGKWDIDHKGRIRVYPSKDYVPGEEFDYIEE